MARIDTFDDSDWHEVIFINGYAVFMGYLMMGVRGLGVLVITWTTVVLLGGFVSVLGKKDFWCLTGITLIQTVGVFNFLLEEILRDFVRSWFGLLAVAATPVIKPLMKGKHVSIAPGRGMVAALVLSLVLSAIQTLVLVIILCPVVVLYMFGMYISAGVGLWRLIEHDFSNAEGGTNLKPALEVLYSLAVAQGLLFCYKTLHGLGAKFGLVDYTANILDIEDKTLISDYLEDTVAGCEKDPSFATGRNIVTYGMDLMVEAKSNDGFIAGITVVGTAVDRLDRAKLVKHLLTWSTSFTHAIQRLLLTLGPISQYSGEIREHAARIVALVADSIFLEQHPGWIQFISSLLDIFDEYSFQRDSRRGFIILQKLADCEDNCRVIINTEGLIMKITAPLVSNQLHEDHHEEWCGIAVESQNLIYQLVAIPGEMGTKLRSEVSRSQKEIISILECLECEVWRKRRTVEILHLSVDTSSVMASGSSGRVFTWILLIVFLSIDDCFDGTWLPHRKKMRSNITRLAGEKLLDLISSNQDLSAMLTSQSDEGSARSMLQSVRVVLGDLTRALLDAGNISNRVHAAKILERLCYKYRKDHEYLKDLNNPMASVMPEVLKEILCYMSRRETVTEASHVKLQEIIVLASGDIPQGNAQETTSCSQQQQGEHPEEKKLWKALVDLCGTIWRQWYREDREDTELTRQLDDIAEKVCSEQGKPVKNFMDLVSEADKLL